MGVEEELLTLLSEGTRLRTPVSLVYHSLSDVNEQLSRYEDVRYAPNSTADAIFHSRC